jgi:hypothetical protein
MPMVINVWPEVPDRLRTRGVNYINGYCLQRLLAETLNDGFLEIKLTHMKSPHSKKMFSNRIFSTRVNRFSITLYPDYMLKRKGKWYPITDPKAQRGSRGIALLFLDLGARRGGWSAPRPSRFTSGKDPVLTV